MMYCRQQPSTSCLPSPSKTSNNNNNNDDEKMDPIKQQIASWKLMENPPKSDPKQKFFRVYGICKEWPLYNVNEVKDPRPKCRFWTNSNSDLAVPDFIVDDEYCNIPPNRELAIVGLNDNIDEKFLTSYCRKVSTEPTEVHIFHHPKTQRHMGMAFLDFNSREESLIFIRNYNEKSIMGSKVACFFDVFAYKLSELYKQTTGKESGFIPTRYQSLFNSNTIASIKRKIEKFYNKEKALVNKDEVKVSKSPPQSNKLPVLSNTVESAAHNSKTPVLMNGHAIHSPSPSLSASIKSDNQKGQREQRDLVDKKNSFTIKSSPQTPSHICTPSPVNTSTTATTPSPAFPTNKNGFVVPNKSPKPFTNYHHKSNHFLNKFERRKTEFDGNRNNFTHRHFQQKNHQPSHRSNYFNSVKLEPTNGIVDQNFHNYTPQQQFYPLPPNPPPLPEQVDHSPVDLRKSSKNDFKIEIMLKLIHDVDKKLNNEALKMLDLAWAEIEKKREEAKRSESEAAKYKPAEHSYPLAAYGLDSRGIFGMSMSKIMSNVPRIRKKIPEPEVIRKQDHYHHHHRSKNLKRKFTNAEDQEPKSRAKRARSKSIEEIASTSESRTSTTKSSSRNRDTRSNSREPSSSRSRSSSVVSSRSSSSADSVSTLTENNASAIVLRPRKKQNRRYSLSAEESGIDDRLDEQLLLKEPIIDDEDYDKTDEEDDEIEGGEEQDRNLESTERDDLYSPPIEQFDLLEPPSYNKFIKDFSELELKVPSKKWPLRTEHEEESILYKYLDEGLDNKECGYIRKLLTDNSTDLFASFSRYRNSAPYMGPPLPPPPVILPNAIRLDGKEYYYADADLDGVVPHASGSARTEGYYKVSQKIKSAMRRHEHSDNRTIISTHDEAAAKQLSQALKNEKSLNRSLADPSSTLCRVNQLKYRSKMIKFGRSKIHGWGLYALENIQPDEMIVEYIGEKIRPSVSDIREKRYELRGMGSSYMFRIDEEAVVDATMKGNFARFINHSCSPNCYAKILNVDRDKRIVIYSKRLIQRGEEITYDYKFPIEDEKIPCLCGSIQCRGSLN